MLLGSFIGLIMPMLAIEDESMSASFKLESSTSMFPILMLESMSTYRSISRMVTELYPI